METIYSTREVIVSFYKRFETFLLIALKFVVGLFVFTQIGNIGMYMPLFESVNSPPLHQLYTLLMAMLFTVMTMTVGYGLIILNICMQISSALGVMMFVGVFLMLILFLYARLAPKESFLIMATFFAFQLGIPYIVPLLAGIYLGITSIIPVSIGVMIVSFVPFFGLLLEDTFHLTQIMDLDFTAMPEYIGGLYVTIFYDITDNNAWVFTSFAFAMVIFVVYVVSRLTIDYSREIALGAGVVVMLISVIISGLVVVPDGSLVVSVFAVMLSGVLAFVSMFFDMVLDYQRTERVQFEDEHNFYQVKVTPKIASSRKDRVIQRVNETVASQKDYLNNDFPRSRHESPQEARAEDRREVRYDGRHGRKYSIKYDEDDA